MTIISLFSLVVDLGQVPISFRRHPEKQ